jgi:hypothetical protein
MIYGEISMGIVPEKAESMVLSEAEAIELFVSLIASARTQLDEPCSYGSMRLLSFAEILRDYVWERVSPENRELLDETADSITFAQMHTADTEEYTAVLDALCRTSAQHLLDQSDLGKKTS